MKVRGLVRVSVRVRFGGLVRVRVKVRGLVRVSVRVRVGCLVRVRAEVRGLVRVTITVRVRGFVRVMVTVKFVFLPETFEEKNIVQQRDLNPRPPAF